MSFLDKDFNKLARPVMVSNRVQGRKTNTIDTAVAKCGNIGQQSAGCADFTEYIASWGIDIKAIGVLNEYFST